MSNATVEEPTSPSAPATEEPVPDEQPASETTEVPQPVEPPRPKTLSPQEIRAAKYQRLQMLEREIDDVDEEMPPIGGGVALTIIGLGGGGTILVHAAIGANACSSCDFTANYAVGLGGLGLGVLGLVVLGTQARKRKPHQERITKLKSERDRLRLDLHGPQMSTGATLTLNF